MYLVSETQVLTHSLLNFFSLSRVLLLSSYKYSLINSQHKVV
jgi:hypothetical protein